MTDANVAAIHLPALEKSLDEAGVRHAAIIVALTLATAFVPRAHAHHAFATEFDASLEGDVKGTVTRVWWQNPHIRYDVSMKMPDGSVQEWALLPPGSSD